MFDGPLERADRLLRNMPRERRVQHLARRLATRYRKREKPRRPLQRKTRKGREVRFIAYDLETTNIDEGTPKPLYITAFSPEFKVSEPLRDIYDLRLLLETRFLTEEHNKTRFIAWNGNNYDAFLVGAALIHNPDFEIQPYFTRGKQLRGMKVLSKSRPKLSWEFLDGMAMIMGGVKKSLKEFLKTFAPDFHKLEAPDFEDGEQFDSANPEHVRYAERDSEGLYWGLIEAQRIVKETFDQVLQPTIGNLGIRLFQQHMPQDVLVWAPSYNLDRIIRKHVMRGGYCFCPAKFKGRIWKYDINQAYAAAMRDSWLPAGSSVFVVREHPEVNCAIYRVDIEHDDNPVPFYVRDDGGLGVFVESAASNIWLTIQELEQLRSEGWRVKVHDGYIWTRSFKMCDYVDTLERLRMSAPGGPNGATGTMIKQIGNNSYGKTVEELDGLEFRMAQDRPEGFSDYQDAEDTLQHIWFKIDKPQTREYHQPQIGAFITAHVRMQLRRAILSEAKAWIYSDTDSVVFSKPNDKLSIDKAKYGKWKVEAAGKVMGFIAKKVYFSEECKIVEKRNKKTGKLERIAYPVEARAKGMNQRLLTKRDFDEWLAGRPPKQNQLQRANFLLVMKGGEMFRRREKVGQRILTGEK